MKTVRQFINAVLEAGNWDIRDAFDDIIARDAEHEAEKAALRTALDDIARGLGETDYDDNEAVVDALTTARRALGSPLPGERRPCRYCTHVHGLYCHACNGACPGHPDDINLPPGGTAKGEPSPLPGDGTRGE